MITINGKNYNERINEKTISVSFRMRFEGPNFTAPMKNDPRFKLEIFLYKPEKYAKNKYVIFDLNEIINKDDLFKIPAFVQEYCYFKNNKGSGAIENQGKYFNGSAMYFSRKVTDDELLFLFESFELKLSDENKLRLAVGE